MRGRPPKPTALKILQGNPGKRLLNQKEPQPQKALLKCPRWLNKLAREEWACVAPELHRLGLLTKVDAKALACYCQVYGRLRQAEAVVAKQGITFTPPQWFRSNAARSNDRPRSYAVDEGFCRGVRLDASISDAIARLRRLDIGCDCEKNLRSLSHGIRNPRVKFQPRSSHWEP